MTLKVVSLLDLLKRSSYSEEDIKSILLSFKTISTNSPVGAVDVEQFLHQKAIEFEKLSLSRTYLIMSSYQKENFIAGYFAITNRPLIINKKNFDKLSNSLKKKLMGVGHKTESQSYEIKGFLLGQLGKNYSKISVKASAVSGDDILSIAYDKIIEAHRIVGGRILYLECEDTDKIKKFYCRNGFREIEDFQSDNNLCIFIKHIEHIV